MLQKVVLFADLLGFAALTESHALDLRALKTLNRLFGIKSFDELLRASRNPLVQAFHGFHSSLGFTLQQSEMRYPLTAITFSDSAFVATEYLYQAADIAGDLVRSLLLQRIPVRVGIAYGSFAAIRFRSDVTDDGGNHAAHFLGTGVVRAHSAESCGIKGLRILFHPSAASLVDDQLHNPIRAGDRALRVVECSAEAVNKVCVSYELDYWSFRRTEEIAAWHALQDMWNDAPESEQRHYIATAEAVNRMRVSRGDPGLTNLRRRTLPRNKAVARNP